MRVFISSVRRGLEAERDALPGLILALGHTPVRFEDFGSLPTPSREACLRAVGEADAYLLLLGPAYGHVWPETGLSATHEEYRVALAQGIPRLAFRKDGIDEEEAQLAFIHEVEDYSTGLFRGTFTNALDLQPKVVVALNRVAESARNAGWVPLPHPLQVEWRSDWASPPQRGPGSRGAELEIHAVPLAGAARLPARQLREAADGMAARLRALGAVPHAAAITTGADKSAAWALPEPPARRGGFNQVQSESLLGVRLAATGQRSAWQEMPADGMGSVLDPDDLPSRIASLIRLLGGLAPVADELWALGIGMRPSTAMSIGSLNALGQRHSATGLGFGRPDLHVDPDEAVSGSALDTGADNVATALARAIFDSFGRQR